tara:strand:- start:22 stop:372 length:351 start_codon:yes stop_codon:yes gene_type:complete
MLLSQWILICDTVRSSVIVLLNTNDMSITKQHIGLLEGYLDCLKALFEGTVLGMENTHTKRELLDQVGNIFSIPTLDMTTRTARFPGKIWFGLLDLCDMYKSAKKRNIHSLRTSMN